MPKETRPDLGFAFPIFRLEEKWVEKLARLPETGMGYQDVQVFLKSGRVVRVIVGNCEYITQDVSFNDDDISDIRVTVR